MQTTGRLHPADAVENQTTLYVPPGWPAAVRPPGAPDWERTAVAFLLDCCPPDFRRYPVLRRHPVILARFAAAAVAAQGQACRAGLGTCRADLAGFVPPDAVEAATAAWQEQEAALRRTAREVALVEGALRGRVYVRKL
nr:hypothetical protein [Propionibacterium sp.]